MRVVQVQSNFESSGDLVADRRYSAAITLLRAGDGVAAADLLERALERSPNWTGALFALGRARMAAYDRAAASEAYRNCLRADPHDRLGAGLELARLDPAAMIDQAPAAYVKNLFDAYAADFDTALVERLGYAVPQKLATLVRTARGNNAPKLARVFDLGCGTGLSGEAIAPDALWIEGVDLSNGMIEEARGKGVYDALSCTDILAFLKTPGENAELILAADVLIYLGDLAAVINAAASRLMPGGLFAFSVERADAGDWQVGESLRFSHSAVYVRRTLEAAGLDILSLEPSVLRMDRGGEVHGLLLLAQRPLHAHKAISVSLTMQDRDGPTAP